MNLLRYTLLFIFFFTVISLNTSAQSVTKGQFTFEPYYGFPNFGEVHYDIYSDEAGYDNFIKRGPWGIRLEYMVDEKLGFTFNGIHNSYRAIDNNTYEYFDENDNKVYTTYYHSTKVDRLRVQFGLNYHLETLSSSFDNYFGLAVGTNHRRFRYDFDDDPFFDEIEDEFTTILPISMRISYGARYFFSDNIGLNGEVGLGGPLVSIGLSIRFVNYAYAP